MRKITQNAVNAFNSKGTFKGGNTRVFQRVNAFGNTETVMELHSNGIAFYNHATKALLVSSCGWMTNTTKERLNGLNGVEVQQKKGVWYLNGKEWDGRLTTV